MAVTWTAGRLCPPPHRGERSPRPASSSQAGSHQPVATSRSAPDALEAGGRGVTRDVASRFDSPPPSPPVYKTSPGVHTRTSERRRRAWEVGACGWGSRVEAGSVACPRLGGGSGQCRVARGPWSSCGLSPISRQLAPRCASRRWARLAAGTRRRSGRSRPPKSRSRRSPRCRCSRPPRTTITTTRTRGPRSRGLSSTPPRGSATAEAKCWER